MINLSMPQSISTSIINLSNSFDKFVIDVDHDSAKDSYIHLNFFRKGTKLTFEPLKEDELSILLNAA